MWAASTHSTEYPLASFSILTLGSTQTQVASTKRVLNGTSFKWSKRRAFSSTWWLNFYKIKTPLEILLPLPGCLCGGGGGGNIDVRSKGCWQPVWMVSEKKV